ncbi:MAG: alpha-2-macroglobulin, partial [Chloroflexaceae bacterium]|nr:alpha-2-macroglobulin [Chloroflexaceae bacterium]
APRNASYKVVIGESARSADGVSLKGPYQFRFATQGYLKVGQVIPADGTPDVATDTALTVIFNRPVVALTTVEQQDTLPHPLTFSPDVEGTGAWLNTSVYVFQPSEPLEPGTTYTVGVADDLQDVIGNPMQEPYSWSFTTALPPEVEVVSVFPFSGSDLVPIETTITVQFDQPVDPASAQSAFQLRSDGGSSVAGDFQVVGTGATLVFTPTQQLAFNRQYTIDLTAGVESASGGRPLPTAYHGTFTTVPLPRITGTDPTDGNTQAPYYTGFTIFFNTPINPATVMPNLQMTPPFSPTQVYTYFSPYDRSFHLHFDVRPSTSYTVHIAPDITDPYGNATGQTLDVHFRTQPRPPSANLVTPGAVGTYSAYNPTRVGLRTVNLSQASLRLYRMEPESLFDSFYGDQIPGNAVLLREWQEPITTSPSEENQGMPTVSRANLAEDGGALEPGVYLLLLERPDAPHYPDRHVLVVSPINLTLKAGERDALVWANDLQSGQPVPDLTVDFYDSSSRNLLGTATTDQDGVARVEIDRLQNRGVIAIARQPFSAADTNWSNGVSPWDFQLPTTSDLPEMAAHIYTDRPIYRPDQTVYFKGVLRNEDDARFSLPVISGPVEVIVMNPAREEVYHETLPVNTYGTFHGELALPESATLGSYTIQVNVNRGNEGDRMFWSEFEVAAYRAPEFQVEVKPQADEIVRGTPLRATVEVAYFFGMPVENAPVVWTVSAVDYRFAPAQYGRYQFGPNDDPWFCWECWWMPGATPEPIMSGSGTTDGQGHLTIDLPADLKDRQGLPISDSVRLTIEATVTGRDNQVVSNRSDVVVHSGAVYVGLASQTYFGTAGEVQAIDVIALDTEEQPQAGQSIEVEVFRLTWENTYLEDTLQWEWEEQETLVHQQTVMTDQYGQAVVSFTPPEGGSYRVVAHAQDGQGHRVRSSLFLWVAGEGYVSWRRDNNDRISLIADKVSYTAGETAEILIPSPFQNPHWALITVERGGILHHEVRKMNGNSTIYRLPLTAEHPPNVFVSVVLFSPPSLYGSGPSVPADYKVGILPLEVKPDPQTLRVSITSDVEQAEPGEEVSFTVEVTDLEGQPVAAELSLDLVDKAVLSLMPRVPNAILKAFYDQRPLGIFTASGLAISADRLVRLDEEEEEQKDGEDAFGEDENLAPSPAPTASPAPSEPGRGEDGSGQGSAPTVREEFADTAYWESTITTDSDGRQP